MPSDLNGARRSAWLAKCGGAACGVVLCWTDLPTGLDGAKRSARRLMVVPPFLSGASRSARHNVVRGMAAGTVTCGRNSVHRLLGSDTTFCNHDAAMCGAVLTSRAEIGLPLDAGAAIGAGFSILGVLVALDVAIGVMQIRVSESTVDAA